MNFYRDFQYLGEKKFLFSIKPILAVLDVSENLYKNKIFVGFRYVYSNVKVTYTFDNLPDSVFDPASFSRNIGNLNLYAEWDSRNTIFTPDKGVRFKASYGVARPWTISDVDFEQYDVFTNIFFRPVKWWVCGFRADWQGISGDAPFYLKPYIDMRGIPAVQYQGDQVLALETELRFDVTKRWSILGFAGTGKTFSSSKYLKDETWHWAGGTGFRYLLARLFGMRMGVDVAMSQGQFAYYIVLGHYWNR
jgi:outer membrane protein assembly factor BamA